MAKVIFFDKMTVVAIWLPWASPLIKFSKCGLPVDGMLLTANHNENYN